MFKINESVEKMLEQGYEEITKHCSLCILGMLRTFDGNLFATEEKGTQIILAKFSAQLIEACTPLNREGTIKDDGVPPEKINCDVLIAHYANKLATADFRVRWEVMLDEMGSDLNKSSARTRFGLRPDEEINFVQLYLNYRLWGAFYTFGDRHPELYISEGEREKDKKSIQAANEITEKIKNKEAVI